MLQPGTIVFVEVNEKPIGDELSIPQPLVFAGEHDGLYEFDIWNAELYPPHTRAVQWIPEWAITRIVQANETALDRIPEFREKAKRMLDQMFGQERHVPPFSPDAFFGYHQN